MVFSPSYNIIGIRVSGSTVFPFVFRHSWGSTYKKTRFYRSYTGKRGDIKIIGSATYNCIKSSCRAH
jgi:hypothetical protein